MSEILKKLQDTVDFDVAQVRVFDAIRTAKNQDIHAERIALGGFCMRAAPLMTQELQRQLDGKGIFSLRTQTVVHKSDHRIDKHVMEGLEHHYTIVTDRLDPEQPPALIDSTYKQFLHPEHHELRAITLLGTRADFIDLMQQVAIFPGAYRLYQADTCINY